MEENTNKSASQFEQQDRALFDQIAEKYSRKDLLPSSQKARQLRLHQSLCKLHLDEQTNVIELGCGAGWSVEYLLGMFREFVGVDYSDQLIRIAEQRHAESDNICFQTGNIKDLDLEARFDVAFMIGVIHHVENIPEALEASVRVLRPGGWLVVNEPQPGNPMIQGLRAIRKRVDKGYSEDQLTLSRNQLLRYFENADLKHVKVYPQGYLSTPFAEVPLPAQPISSCLSGLACAVDRVMDRVISERWSLSWNLVAMGQKQ